MPPADPQVLQHPQRLASLAALHLLDTSPEPAYDRLTHLARQLLKTAGAFIALLSDARLFFKSQVGLAADLQQSREMRLVDSFCQHLPVIGRPLIVEDALHHPLVHDSPAIAGYGWKAYIGIPLLPDGQHIIGALCVVDSAPRVWSDTECALLQDVAQAVCTEMRLLMQRHENEQLQRSIQHLEQTTIDMLRSAAHKLLGPIHVMQGYLDMHKEVAGHPVLNPLQEAIEEMRLIIQDVMTIGETEQITRLPDDPVNLTEEISAVIQRLDSLAAPAQKSLEVELAPDLRVKGSASQLREAILNLVSNALKYSPDRATIRVVLHVADGRVVFEVVDTGYGIPDIYQPNLFQPFYRVVTRETAPIKGTGLGLYLVKAIITRHGGEVFFQSEYGRGSTFGFKLPVYP